MNVKKLMSAMLALTLMFTFVPAINVNAHSSADTEIVTQNVNQNARSNSVEKVLAVENYYIDRAGNMIPVEQIGNPQIVRADIVDAFNATFYYTGIDSSGYKNYKVTYTLTSLESGRYYTSSTIYATPKNSSSTHSESVTYAASKQKTVITDSVSYRYTSNPPDVPAVTVSCNYNTTTGTGYIVPHTLTSPIDIS